MEKEIKYEKIQHFKVTLVNDRFVTGLQGLVRDFREDEVLKYHRDDQILVEQECGLSKFSSFCDLSNSIFKCYIMHFFSMF